MWPSFKEKAKRLEVAVNVWRFAPSAPRFMESIRAGTEIFGYASEISRSKEQTAGKIVSLGRVLAHVRRSMVTIEGAIKAARGSQEPPGPHVVMIAYMVALAALWPIHHALLAPDASFATVPLPNIALLLNEFGFLRPLAQQLRATPRGAWGPVLDSLDVGEGATMVNYLGGIMQMVKIGVETLETVAGQHSKGLQLAAEKKLGLGSLAGALWDLAPVISTWLEAAEARSLCLQWTAIYSTMSSLGRKYTYHIPQELDSAFPLLTTIVTAVAQMQATGGREEQEAAFECLRHVDSLVLTLIDLDKHYSGDVYEMFCRRNVSPGALDAFITSISNLWAAAIAPGTSFEFSLLSLRLILGACSAAGFYMTEGVKSATALYGVTLTSPSCANCIDYVSKAWLELVRRSADAPGWDFWAQVGSFVQIMRAFFGACSGLSRLTSESTARIATNPNRAEYEHFASLIKSPPAPIVRSLAAMSAAMPAALALAPAHSDYPVLEAARNLTSELFIAGPGYAIAAMYCHHNPLDIAHAAHASIHAALVLQAAEGWCPGQALAAPLNVPTRHQTLGAWYGTTVLLESTLNAFYKGEAAAALVTLHLITAAAELRECRKAIVDLHRSNQTVYKPSDIFCAALVPKDAEGMELLADSGALSPAETTKLRQLASAAKSTAGLEERQKRRLELLGHLPQGICGNLRCFKSLPAGDRLKVCSGCGILRVCSLSCLKYAWKHGDHREPCLATQREREREG